MSKTGQRYSTQALASRIIAPTLVLLLGVGLSIFFYFTAMQWEEENIDREFIVESNIIFYDLVEAYQRSLIVSEALQGLMHHGDDVTQAVFEEFANPLHSFLDGIIAMEWVPRIAAADRNKFVETIRAQGLPDFSIREISDQKMVDAALREQYFPVTFVHPFEGNEPALGLDLISNPARKKALVLASKSGLPTASERVQLAQAPSGTYGVLLFSPTFQEVTTQNNLSPLEQLKGTVILVLRLDKFLHSALSELQFKGLGVYIHDLSAELGQQFLHGYQVTEGSYESALQGRHRDSDFMFGQRLWRVTCVPLPNFYERFHTFFPLGGAVGILVITALLAGYLFLVLYQREKIRSQVAQKTDDLQRLVVRLNCLYEVSHMVERPGVSVDEVLHSIPQILEPAFSGFSNCAVQVFYNGSQYGALAHKDAPMVLSEPINAPEHIGQLAVYQEAPVLSQKLFPQKQAFLKNVAVQLAMFIERRSGEKKLIAAKDAAEEATQAKSLFLANMSHEIRTPLNAIIGMAELVGKTSLTPRQEDYFSKIGTASRSLLDIVNDILDFSKIEAGKLELEKVEFSLSGILKKILDIYGPRALQKGLDFTVNTQGELPSRVVGDPLRFEQVFANLVSNAVKFTEKGSISIGISLLKKDAMTVRIRGWVTDTGIGVESEVQGGLFEAFMQADVSHTRQHGGTGLGLAIAHQLSGLMGGELAVLSQHGVGSTFSFEADLALNNNLVLPAPQPFVAGEQALLISNSVEDFTLFLLNGAGFVVEEFKDGESAWQYLEAATLSPSLVWVDSSLAQGRGIDFVQRVRASTTEFSSIPIVFATTSLNETLRDLAKSLTFAVLLRPVESFIALDTIKRILNLYSESPSSAVIQGDTRILVVDDNSVNRQILQELLEDAGVFVQTAENGQQAVDMALGEKSSFNAILMDIQMPVMDGLTATRLIREKRTAAQLPIIALTAHALVEDRQKAQDAGMNDFVSKPIDIKLLFGVLAKFINQHEWEVPENKPDQDQVLGFSLLYGVDVKSGLERLGGKSEVYKRLLFEFMVDYKSSAVVIRDKLLAGEHPAALALVHTIKGVSGNMAAVKVHEAVKALEIAIKQERPYDTSLNNFEEQFNLLLESLEKFVELEKSTEAMETCTESDPLFLEKIRELKSLLQDNDFRATQVFADARTSFKCSLSDENMQSLEKAITGFDFQRGAELLGTILMDMESTRSE